MDGEKQSPQRFEPRRDSYEILRHAKVGTQQLPQGTVQGQAYLMITDHQAGWGFQFMIPMS